MRAFPVNRDTIDLLVTAACITLPAYRTVELASDIVATADQLGQLLWDENHSSVSYATGERMVAPAYEWQPVAEIIPLADAEQLLQLERSRLMFEEVSCHHDGWDDSPARAIIEQLHDEIALRFLGRPLAPSAEHAGVMEYAGLSRAVEMWQREIGFRHPLTADTAA